MSFRPRLQPQRHLPLPPHKSASATQGGNPPTAEPSTYAQQPEIQAKRTATGTSSWGWKIIHDPHNLKLFHSFLAEFTHGCGLDYWSPYSRIIHATSKTGLQGPCEFEDEVVGTFAHNPTVVYEPHEKLYLLYYISCPFTPPPTCTSSNLSCGPGNTLKGESGISVLSSPDLKTWTSHGQVFPGRNKDVWDADVTNPSPFLLSTPQNPTSEIALAYRGCPNNCSGSERINLATAPNFLGPYTKIQLDPIFADVNEDPFLW